MWRALLVAGVTTDTAGWPSTYLMKNCAQLAASKSAAQAGRARSPTR